MADYTKFFKKQEEAPVMNETDQQKLQAYTDRLDTYDPKEALRKQMEQQMLDNDKAMEISGRGMFQDKTPEEQAFEEKHLDPYTRGMMQGGFMGGVSSVGKGGAELAAKTFPRLQKMFNVGDQSLPSNTTAEAVSKMKSLSDSGLGKTLVEDIPEVIGKVKGPVDKFVPQPKRTPFKYK